MNLSDDFMKYVMKDPKIASYMALTKILEYLEKECEDKEQKCNEHKTAENYAYCGEANTIKRNIIKIFKECFGDVEKDNRWHDD